MRRIVSFFFPLSQVHCLVFPPRDPLRWIPSFSQMGCLCLLCFFRLDFLSISYPPALLSQLIFTSFPLFLPGLLLSTLFSTYHDPRFPPCCLLLPARFFLSSNTHVHFPPCALSVTPFSRSVPLFTFPPFISVRLFFLAPFGSPFFLQALSLRSNRHKP